MKIFICATHFNAMDNSHTPKCSVVVSYIPFGTEPDPVAFSSLFPQPTCTIPPDKEQDSYKKAEEISALIGAEENVCLLIPGSQFDERGTRHGRGGGWYDRFLSQVPKEWVRIGVATPGSYSRTPLTRQEWDEPVDWIGIVTNNRVKFIQSIEKRI